MHKVDEIATSLLGAAYDTLDERAKKVAQHVAQRTHIARNIAQDLATPASVGQRAADAVAPFGGSWTFVGMFAAVMLVWVVLNALLLVNRGTTFDPYPLLNLFLYAGGHPGPDHPDVPEPAVRERPHIR
jgi:uncharacterized membrane protein